MAKPPKLKTLRPEDFDFNGEATEWGPKLLQTLSSFCGDVTNALSRQLTRADNIRGEERDVIFTTNSNVTTADASPWPVSITPQTATQPKNVYVTAVENLTDSSAVGVPSGAVLPIWRLDSKGNVVFRFFTSLNVDTKYRIRVVME
jgi:hypothetical protein